MCQEGRGAAPSPVCLQVLPWQPAEPSWIPKRDNKCQGLGQSQVPPQPGLLLPISRLLSESLFNPIKKRGTQLEQSPALRMPPRVAPAKMPADPKAYRHLLLLSKCWVWGQLGVQAPDWKVMGSGHRGPGFDCQLHNPPLSSPESLVLF